ncbi:calcium-binding protein [Cognatishimia sp. F0-27]|uniref:calcium-binding protein n=1 Tax=Cognatishimia sp. F0-27 TaxID=2816855 RepID=UPI001D0C6A65|nr:calcium-binding protein [Cognatishimia sp. F0-27]MCC1492985.1 calcium-binding protein [Cognatishimia sp. F0-27]
MSIVTFMEPIVQLQSSDIGTLGNSSVEFPGFFWARDSDPVRTKVSWMSWADENWTMPSEGLLEVSLPTSRSGAALDLDIRLQGNISGIMNPEGSHPWPARGAVTGFDILGPDGSVLVNVAVSTAVGGVSPDWFGAAVPNIFHSAVEAFAGGPDRILGSEAGERGDGYGGNDSISMFGGNDYAYGGPGADIVRGGDGADRVFGGTGDDVVAGEGGNDKVSGGMGDDTIDGGDGLDMVLFTGLPATLIDPVSRIDLEAGLAVGAYGTDILRNIEHAVGSHGHDTIRGTEAHANVLEGRAGDDVIYGLGGNDSLRGQFGADMLSGGAGSDLLEGDFGNDTLWGGTGTDTLDGGDGQDQAVFTDASEPLHVNLLHGTAVSIEDGVDVPDLLISIEDVIGGAAWDQIYGTQGNNRIEGQAGDDSLWGLNGGDSLFGQDGNDSLWGGSGRDMLEGGDGDDVLVGGSGADTMYGGDGADVFVIDIGSFTGDHLNDFNAAEGDLIDMSHLDADPNEPGRQPFYFQGEDSGPGLVRAIWNRYSGSTWVPIYTDGDRWQSLVIVQSPVSADDFIF